MGQHLGQDVGMLITQGSFQHTVSVGIPAWSLGGIVDRKFQQRILGSKLPGGTLNAGIVPLLLGFGLAWSLTYLYRRRRLLWRAWVHEPVLVGWRVEQLELEPGPVHWPPPSFSTWTWISSPLQLVWNVRPSWLRVNEYDALVLRIFTSCESNLKNDQ